MNKLSSIRKAKSVFIKWNLHHITEPVSNGLLLGTYMGKLSKWLKEHPVKGYNDFYQPQWDYSRRFTLYAKIAAAEQLDQPMDYLEFGVASGASYKWWLQHNRHGDSRFYGFDTFEGLPEKWGHFDKGAMSFKMETLGIDDPRASFYKGLFQDTLVPFLEQYKSPRRKLIHLDADLFSSTLFVLTQFYRFLNDGDIILFDEFAVPQHEFLAFKLFTESFYIKFDIIGAANNYMFLAVRIKKDA